METINLSGEPLILPDLDKKGLEKLVILPDYSPGKGKLPVGVVAIYSKSEHIPSSEFIGPDIGCGMALARFDEPPEDLKYAAYGIAGELQLAQTELGSLGGGNHFINIYEVDSSEDPESELIPGEQVVLIHSGSRLRGVEAYNGGLIGRAYLEEYQEALEFGRENRERLLRLVEKVSGRRAILLLDQPHNTLEETEDHFIYRKGAVKLREGELTVIPSSFSGKAIIVRAKDMSELMWSINHGTGRKIPRREARQIVFDSEEIRKRVFIPHFISDDSLRTENPACYRTIEEITPAIKPYVEIVARLTPKAYVR